MQCFRHHRHPRRPHRTHHPRNPRLATVTLALSSSARKPNMHTSRSTGPPVCSCRGKGDTEAQMYRQYAHVSHDSGRSTGGSVGAARTQSPTSRLHLTLPTQVGVVPFRCSRASHFLETLAGGRHLFRFSTRGLSGIPACTSCRSGTIRASNASRLLISSSLDGSKAI